MKREPITKNFIILVLAVSNIWFAAAWVLSEIDCRAMQEIAVYCEAARD